MTAKSQRLQRVARKYALDQRLAQFDQAKAERERQSLERTHDQLGVARRNLLPDNAPPSASDFAAMGEWADRLDRAATLLCPSIERARQSAVSEARRAQQAKGRIDTVAQKIVDAVRIETNMADARATMPQRLRRKP